MCEGSIVPSLGGQHSSRPQHVARRCSPGSSWAPSPEFLFEFHCVGPKIEFNARPPRLPDMTQIKVPAPHSQGPLAPGPGHGRNSRRRECYRSLNAGKEGFKEMALCPESQVAPTQRPGSQRPPGDELYGETSVLVVPESGVGSGSPPTGGRQGGACLVPASASPVGHGVVPSSFATICCVLKFCLPACGAKTTEANVLRLV